jgi:LDH2 family malate/lactate/ureidoglycolate dehydrogenase
MTGSAHVPHTSSHEHPTTLGQWLLAVSLDALGDARAITAELDELIDLVKRSRPAAGHNAVRYPGELAAATELVRRRDGVPVRDEDWERLLAFADEQPPAPRIAH